MSELSGNFDAIKAGALVDHTRSAATRAVYRLGTRSRLHPELGHTRLELKDEQDILQILGLIPEPSRKPGTCRKCENIITNSELGIGTVDICKPCRERRLKESRQAI